MATNFSSQVIDPANILKAQSFLRNNKPPILNDEWDVLTLVKIENGVPGKTFVFPGYVRLDLAFNFNYIKSRTADQMFPTVKFSGAELRTVNVEFLIPATNDYLSKWQAMVPELLNKTDALNQLMAPKFSIIHPHAQIYGINEIYLENISSMQPNARDGWTIRMAFSEVGREPAVSGKAKPAPTVKGLKNAKNPAAATVDEANKL